MRPYLEKKSPPKRDGGVAQHVGPEFIPQNWILIVFIVS
jgi:hypothetical protein